MSNDSSDVGVSELGRLLAVLMRAGWVVRFEPVQSVWGRIEGDIIFESLDSEPRAVIDEMAALKEGDATGSLIRWHVHLFEPETIEHAIRRFHQLFLRKPA